MSKNNKKDKKLFPQIDGLPISEKELYKITRRAFNKIFMGTLGAGVTMGSANLFSGCGDSGDSKTDGSPVVGGSSHKKKSREFNAETHTLHFDFSNLSKESVHTLHAAGKKITLQAHDEESLKKAVEDNQGLEKHKDKLTHYASDIQLSSDKPHRIFVTTKAKREGAEKESDCLVGVHMHIPVEHRKNAKEAAKKSGKFTEAKKQALKVCNSNRNFALVECSLEDELEDQFISAFETAKAIVSHHPEIMNIDPSIAAEVEQHIENSSEVMNLAQSICNQGPAWEHDPDYLDGWAILVALENDDGTAQVDQDGEQIYRYDLSEQILKDLNPAVHQVLGSIKNDPDLHGKQYTTYYDGEDPEDTKSSGLISQPLTAQQPLISNSVEASASGYHHNVWFHKPEMRSEREFSIKWNNMNFIWYGCYYQFLDANGDPIEATKDEIKDDLMEYGMYEIDLSTKTTRWKTFVGAPAVVFGVPISGLIPTEERWTLPEGASSCRIMFVGPGTYCHHGHLEAWELLLFGILLTAIVQYAIPIFLMATTSGENEDVSLKAVLKSKGVIINIIKLVKSIVSLIVSPSSKTGIDLAGSFGSLISAIANDLITQGLVLKIPAIAAWITEKVTEEEVEEAIPFAGWAMKIAANLGAAADMVAATAEILANPYVIDNKISLTHTVDITLAHDPNDYMFPRVAKTMEILIYTGKNPIKKTFDLTETQKGQETITVSMSGIPATAKSEKIRVIFYSDTQWIAAEGTDHFLNKVPSKGGKVTADITITENPVPVTKDTNYSQQCKLGYKDNKYQWDFDAAVPKPEQLSADTPGGNLSELNNITIWVPGGMLGYSWRASSKNIKECGGKGTGQLYMFQNVNLRPGKAEEGFKSPGCGYPNATAIAYDYVAKNTQVDGRHFYLDALNTNPKSPQYHLRKIRLDKGAADRTYWKFDDQQTWGMFTMPLNRMAVTPNGYVVGISTEWHRIGILRLPSKAYSLDQYKNDEPAVSRSLLAAGKGKKNDALLYRPVALAVTKDSDIIVLEGGGTHTIKSFSVEGKPRKIFKKKKFSKLVLTQTVEDAKKKAVTMLDIAVELTGLIYVLSYTDQGSKQSDYHLDVYSMDGTHVVRNSGIAVSRMVVDPFRILYSLNPEKMLHSPITEPTVSIWTPSTPDCKKHPETPGCKPTP